MADRVSDWVELLAARYPPADAEPWDHVGLQVGDPAGRVSRVLVALEVTEAVLDEAGAVGAELVLTHHPLLFRPLAALTPDSAAGRLALRAAQEGRAVLAAHTNLDVAEEATTTPIVELLGLDRVRPLDPRSDPGGEIRKLTTFVPREHTGAVIAALSAAGAGIIGAYDECTFRVAGTGTFRPSAAANPERGARGQRNEVAEDRLEVEVRRDRLAAALAALEQAHPYEEVAYDVYLLDDRRPARKGLGRIGELAEPTSLRAVADALAAGLPSPHLRVAGDLDRPVRRVAACGGAGDSLIDAALAAGADVYVTGDLRHHPALDARTQGLALIDAGHHATEAAALPLLRAALVGDAAGRGLAAEVTASAVDTDPWEGYRPAPTAAGAAASDEEGTPR
ncbi:MAG: Nif3-like dinuclear metal center hexameric protein [Actinomycetota bacterium]